MKQAANDQQPVFYLDEYPYIEYWPHRLASAIRGDSDQEHDEDFAFQLLKNALNTSLAPWDLDRSLHRSPLSAADIERMVESLQGALIFSQHHTVDVSWFRESLESIAEERTLPISSRYILYRVEATFVEEDEPELYLVDQLNGEAWHILPDLFPGIGWGYDALPQFSVSPLYVHAKHSGLRGQELQLASLPDCIVEDLRNAIPSIVAETEPFSDEMGNWMRTWIPIAAVHNDQVVPCLMPKEFAGFTPAEMFYIGGVPGIALWANYDANFILKELDNGLSLFELDDANYFPDSAIIAATGLLMIMLGKNGANAFDENSMIVEAKAFRTNSVEIGMVLSGLLTHLINPADAHEIDDPYFWINSPVLEMVTDANYQDLPAGKDQATLSLYQFLSTHREIQLLKSVGSGYGELNNNFHLLPENRSVIRAKTYLLSGVLEGKRTLYRGVYGLSPGGNDPKANCETIAAGISDEDLVALYLLGTDLLGIGTDGNFSLTDYCDIEFFKTHRSDSEYESFLPRIKRPVLTHPHYALVVEFIDLKNSIGEAAHERLSSYSHLLDETMYEVALLGKAISPMRSRQMMAATVNKIATKLKQAGFDFTPLRSTLNRSVKSIANEDFIGDLSYNSTRMMEGHYVTDDSKIEQQYYYAVTMMYYGCYLLD